MITARTGEQGRLKIFLFRGWVPVDILAEFGGGPLLHVYVYPDQVVSIANRIEVVASFGALANEVDFQIVETSEAALPPGRYGVVVDIASSSGPLQSFWPATGSEQLIVGEAS